MCYVLQQASHVHFGDAFSLKLVFGYEICLSEPSLRDLSPKKLSCFSPQGRVDFLQLMIESQKSTSHGSNGANHSYKGNNIQIFITRTGTVGARGIWGAVSQRKAQQVTTISTDQLQAEVSVPSCQHQG